jgi:hypothetical protein
MPHLKKCSGGSSLDQFAISQRSTLRILGLVIAALAYLGGSPVYAAGQTSRGWFEDYDYFP